MYLSWRLLYAIPEFREKVDRLEYNLKTETLHRSGFESRSGK